MSSRRIAIVGAGLTGLTVAFRRASAGDDVTVFEAGGRLGGQLSTAREHGFLVELGAEGFVARSEVVPALAREVGLESDLVGQNVTTSYRWDGSALVALAPGEAAEALSFQVARAHKGSGIRTFGSGMQALTDALGRALEGRAAVRIHSAVTRLARRNDATVVCVGDEEHPFDAVVLALPSAPSARLLAASELGLPPPEGLARAETLSSVTVSLAFSRDLVDHPLDGTGFVVADPFEGFRACTFTTSKFDGRAPRGWVSLRAFFRPTPDELSVATPWAERAARVLGTVLPIHGAPAHVWVSVWPDALPVFTPEHREAVTNVESALAPIGIHLAGSAFHGSGIDAAVRSANDAAARLD
jgi:protoporphyrinogen/coproporphyrinogen III oxidase